MNESNQVIRDAKKLGLPKMLILGVQHMFAMFGATILVPILVNSYFMDACGEHPTYGSGNTILRRIWNIIIPCMCKNEGSGIPRFFFCVLRWIFYSSAFEYGNLCRNECK